MATTRTTNAALQKPGTADRNWDVPINANADALDAMTALGALAVRQSEYPSTTLGIAVAAGNYRKADGTLGTYAGGTATAPASATTLYWLTDAGVLTSGAAFPTTAHIRLATVVAGATTITSITDERAQLSIIGTGQGFVLKAGDTLPEGANFVLGTTTGTKIGTATSQKLAFYNSTPIVKPAALTAANASALNTGDATSDTVIANMRTRIGELEAKLQALGLLS